MSVAKILGEGVCAGNRAPVDPVIEAREGCLVAFKREVWELVFFFFIPISLLFDTINKVY